MRTKRIGLEDRGEPSLDLRIADGILVFATALQQAARLFGEVVDALSLPP